MWCLLVKRPVTRNGTNKYSLSYFEKIKKFLLLCIVGAVQNIAIEKRMAISPNSLKGLFMDCFWIK